MSVRRPPSARPRLVLRTALLLLLASALAVPGVAAGQGRDADRVPAKADAPIEVVPADENIAPPRVRVSTQHAPVYPPAAKGARMSGAVIVQAEIGKDGKVARVAVLESTHPNLGFEDAAMKAVKEWEFHPARHRETGEPVVYVTQYRLTFGEVDRRSDERPRMIAGGVPAPSRTPGPETPGARDAGSAGSGGSGGSRRR